MTDQVIDTTTGMPADPFRVPGADERVSAPPVGATSVTGEADLLYLWARLGVVEWRVRQALADEAADDPDPRDPYRGLYLTAEAVQRVLDSPRQPPLFPPRDDLDLEMFAAAVPPPGPRLTALIGNFGLELMDVELLLVALAPDVDPRFERLYGYLNDDVTRRRATVGLALRLCGVPAAGPGRFRLAAGAPLVAGGLVEVRNPAEPGLARALHVSDRVVAHLLGDDAPDPSVAGLIRVVPQDGAPAAELPGRLGAGLRAGVGPVHLRDIGGGAGPTAVAALATAGRDAVVVDVAALAGQDHPDVAAVVREARLRGAGIVFGPLEPLVPERAQSLRELVGLAGDVPVVLHSKQHWDPKWTARPVLSVPVPSPRTADRAAWWTRAFGGEPAFLPDLAGYRLNAEEVGRAAAVATRLAVVEGRPVGLEHVRAGVRAQNGAGLDRLARRIVPSVGWDDVVLPEQTRQQLTELVVRARHRERVLGEWGMRPGGGRGRGVVALFAGESGTGKTMSAEVVAAEIGMDLYVVDLSTVVDKYVGETEKNLERIFTEAAGVHGVLVFDEADAVFGKRSEVQSAHDRYANVESAYLLQRMESFDGIAVLTTNLRSNMDEAFTRRIDVIADFPVPDAEQRLALWDRCLGPALPRSDDLDLGFCAERFELAGGSIRACAVSAAYLAAAADRPVAMADVMTAVHQEYRKLGRLVLESEFGPWLSLSS